MLKANIEIDIKSVDDIEGYLKDRSGMGCNDGYVSEQSLAVIQVISLIKHIKKMNLVLIKETQ